MSNLNSVIKDMRWRFAVLCTVFWCAIEINAKPFPTYFRHEAFASRALTNLVVADFDGDGHADIAGLELSQRALVVWHGKGKLAFRAPHVLNLPVRVRSLVGLSVAREKHASLAMLTTSPARVQLWQLSRAVGKFLPEKRAELALSETSEQLYLLKQQVASGYRFLARTEMGTLLHFSFEAKEGFSKAEPLRLAHRVSGVILPARATSDFFTQELGENVLWFHRQPYVAPLAIRCKESVLLAATEDFNRNDLLDLVTVQTSANGKVTVEIMFDIGVETGVAPIRFETQLNPTSVFIEDFNADGLLDIGLCNKAAFAIHFARSATTFSESMVIAFSNKASGVMVADLNQDRSPELIVSEQRPGKLVIYSTSYDEVSDIERLATSGEPELVAVYASQRQMLVSCNQHHRLEQIKIDRWFSHLGSFSVTGKIVSLWQDEFEVSWLTTSPVALVRNRSKSEVRVSHRLFLLGISQACVWHALAQQPTVLAVLETRMAGAVPQLLFYALNRDSTLSIGEMQLETPISAENIASICSATLRNKHYLVVLKSEKNARAIVVYELKMEKLRLHLVETGRYALPNGFATQAVQRLLVKVNKNETMDFLVVGAKESILLLAEQLYQPQRISNFPKIEATDVVFWGDSNGDNLADLVVGRQRRSDVLFLQGRSSDQFHTPKVILTDVKATAIAPVVTKNQAILFVANAKLHTIDMLRLKK